jgi:MFS family permease
MSQIQNGPVRSVQPARSNIVPLWRNRDYLLLRSGQTVSALGSGISHIAYPLLILLLTHSPAQAGIAGALREAPYFFLCLPVGALIDRWDRKKVMILCEIGRALCLGSIPAAFLVGKLTFLQLAITALLEGTFYVFFDLAEHSCLPNVVPQQQLADAVAQSAIMGGGCDLISPWLGAVLYSIQTMLPFLADAISFAASALSLLLIRLPFQQQRSSPAHPLRFLHHEIAEGLTWLWRQPLIRSLSIFTGIINLVFPESSGFLVIVLAQSMHATPETIGLIGSAGSMGYLLGSIISGPIQRKLRFGHIIAGCCWLFALGWLLYAFVPNLLTLALVTAFLMLLDPIYDVAQYSRRAAIIPDALMGRAQSAYRLIALSTPALGYALIGPLLQYLGRRPTVLFFEIFLLLLALLATFNRHVQRAGPLEG